MSTPERPKVWTVDFTTDGFEFPTTNPLAQGIFCPNDDTRIDDRGGSLVRPCPLCGYIKPEPEGDAA